MKGKCLYEMLQLLYGKETVAIIIDTPLWLVYILAPAYHFL